jgi:hypothetical protein
MSRYLSTSLSRFLFSAVSHVGAAYKPRPHGASEGNGIWTNENFERLSDHRPVWIVGQIAEEVTDAAVARTPHITPAIRIMSMFQRHLLNPEDKDTMEKVLFQ